MTPLAMLLPTALFLSGLGTSDVEPRVFRSVLDGRPRMVTLRLHPEMWVAWDATTCSLVRAWRGDVDWDGAVYTTVHGPQPSSRGTSYLELDRPYAWRLEVGDQTLEGKPRFTGYRVSPLVRLYSQIDFGGEVIAVVETILVGDDGDRVRLERAFHSVNLPDDAVLSVRGLDGDEEWTELLPYHRHQLSFDVPELVAEGDEPPEEREVAELPRGVAPGELHVQTLADGYEEYGPRERGVSMRVYDVDVGLSDLPELVAGQTPNVNAIVPRVELFGPSGFGGLEETFITVLTGFVESVAGTHTFRLSSDDGSELVIDGELLIDNDGLHGHEGVEGTIELEAGLHAFQIRHFENGGSESLLLEWRTPGTYDLEVVPDIAYSCVAGEVRVTSPGEKEVELSFGDRGPGDGYPLEDVHPSFDLATVRPESFEPRVGGMDWLSDGRLVICTWDPTGSVYALEGVSGDDPEAVTVTRIASGLAEPLGLTVVDDRIFVLQKQELTELIDTDADGLPDFYRCVSSGWDVTANFHEFAFGLVYKDEHFYANLAIAIDPGGASSAGQVADRGTTIRIDPITGAYETVARGLRTPNGIGLGTAGEIFLTDNQGDWLPVSKLLRLEEGAFYGQRAVLLDEADDLEVTPPVVWLPQGEIGNSPSEPTLIPPGNGPYSGQMIHGEVTHGGVKRVFLEEHAGILQGVVFRFTQGLEAGVNRLTWGPDGALYVGGIGSTGNWGQEGKLSFGLQRLAYNETTTFEMLAVRAFENGFEVELTEAIDEATGWDPLMWQITQWRYEPTAQYGGPKLDEEELFVRSSTPSHDGKRIFVEIVGLRPDRVVHLRIAQPLVSASGRRLWATEAWYTMNRVPRTVCDTAAPPTNANVLTDEEREAGWELLFDGDTLEHWRGFRREDAPEGWSVVDGTISRAGPGGDLITRETYEDFELSLEWRISRGGNSGIFFRVTEDYGATWQTGPEMQVLDNGIHRDGGSSLTSAGANYALHAPARDVTRPVGQYNHAVIKVWDDHVEHWLNGEKIVEYKLASPQWERLVAESKFVQMPSYGRAESGHLALQDHGDPVYYRNVKVRRL